MSNLSRAIGDRFEKIFSQQFSDFQRTDENSSGVLPDFFNGSFWVETKTGFIDYGARIKKEQIFGFSRLEEPVIYCIGYHNFEKSTQRLKRKSRKQMDRILERSMSIDLAYFITDSVMKKIYKMESRTSDSSGITYCMLKWRHPRNIVQNNRFVRSENTFTPQNYYQITRKDLLLAPPIPENTLFGASKGCGFILDKTKDEVVIDYFSKMSSLKLQLAA